MPMRSTVGVLLSAPALWGCLQDFPCAVDADCHELFGALAVCAERQAALGKRCYVKSAPRQCEVNGEIIVSTNIEPMASYGGALSISDSTILVGAYNGQGGYGAVEVINLLLSRDRQSSLFSFLPLDDPRFGNGVSVRGARAVVLGRNSVYFGEKAGASWKQTATLSPPENGSFNHGTAIADRVAFAESYATVSGSERYYVNIFPAGDVNGCKKTLSSPIQEFGYTLAVTDRWLAIGARGGVNGVNSQVCMFDFGEAICPAAPSCRVLSRSVPGNDGFGAAVALSGTLLAVGAPKQAGATVRPFFFYENTDSMWQESVQPENVSAADWGSSLAMDGDLLAVGAPGADSGRGRARIYQWRNRQWVLLSELTPPASTAGGADFSMTPGFGKALAVSGDTVVVGAPSATVDGQAGAGAVVIYRCPPGNG